MTFLTAESDVIDDESTVKSTVCKPDWLEDEQLLRGEKLVVPEWAENGDDDYRSKNGWTGRDLVHNVRAPVRITDYFVQYGIGDDIQLVDPPRVSPQRGGAGTVLTGLAEFTADAESHAGFCHGGSMCSIMDDIVGWIAFCVTGSCRPWTGFTVQVNTALTKPVKVNSTLLLQAEITKVERRKVFVFAKLIDPAENNAVHATCEGLVILNKGILLAS